MPVRRRRVEGSCCRVGIVGNCIAKILEPISKSPEEDDEASELDEAEEVLGVILPAHKYAALPLDPGEEAFYQPAALLKPLD